MRRHYNSVRKAKTSLNIVDPCCDICYNFANSIKIKEPEIARANRLNHEIRAQQLRVISEDGLQLGVMSKSEALRAAEEAGLDLVEISPNANPPVVKIIDWGKFNYQRTKQIQKNKRNTKVIEIKQMRLGLKISDHDLDVKMRKVKSFLEAGHKVKIGVWYKGREMAHQELGFKLANKVIELFDDTIVVEQSPKLAGRQLSFVIRSSNAKVKES